MLRKKDACHDNLKRIADTLRISMNDFHVNSNYLEKHAQTSQMLVLWEKLTTKKMREDALDAIEIILQKKLE